MSAGYSATKAGSLSDIGFLTRPVRIRGSLLAMYSLFFGLGQLACSIGLQIVNVSTPFGYRNAFYSEFVLLGLFVPALVFAPESPCKSISG